MRFLSLFFVLLIPLSSFGAVELEYEGVRGFWFPEDTGTEMLLKLEKYDELDKLKLDLELKIFKQETKIEKLDYKLDKFKYLSEVDEEIFKRQDKIIKEQEETIDLMSGRIDNLTEKNDKWYNSKILWFGAGFIISSVLCIGTVFSIDRVR